MALNQTSWFDLEVSNDVIKLWEDSTSEHGRIYTPVSIFSTANKTAKEQGDKDLCVTMEADLSFVYCSDFFSTF